MAWDDTPPRKDELKLASPPSWDAEPPKPEELGRPPNTDEQAFKNINRMNESGDTSNDALFNALTFGHLPQIKAKAKQIFGGDGIANDDKYVKLRDQEIADEKARAEKFPGAHYEGMAAGFAAPFMVSGGASAAPMGIGQAIDKSARIGAVMGALQNPGDEAGKVDPVQGWDRAKGAAIGGTLGAAIPAGLDGLSKAPGAVANVGKKAVSTFLGPSEEAISARYQNPEQIKNAPSVENIKDSLDDAVQGLFSAVDNAQVSRDQAHAHLKNIEQEVRDATKDASFRFNIKSADTRDQLRQAQQQLEQAFGSQKQDLSSVPHPIHLASDVNDAIGELKDQVSRGSSESYGILDNDKRAYSVRNAAPILRKIADDMNIQPFDHLTQGEPGALVNSTQFGAPRSQAVGPATPHTAGVQKEIYNLASVLEQTPERVPATELKKILQQIDDSNKAMYGQPGFDSRVSKAYKLVRGTIDDAVKTANPEYAAKMEEVAQKTGLLNHAIDRFGSPQMTQSRLNSIGSRTSSIDRDLLQNLGDATQRDFSTPIDRYMQAQEQIKSPDTLRKGLPEFHQAQDLTNQTRALGRPEAAPEYVQQHLDSLGLPSARSGAQSAVDATEQSLADAQGQLDPFKSLTPRNTQNAVKGLMKSPGAESIDLRRKIQNLSDLTGTDFNSQINDRRLADQFTGSYRNGSRNAVIGGTIGGGIGQFVGGHMGALAGAGIGTAAGGVVDRFGPQIAGKLVDTASAASKTPIAQLLMKTPRFAEMAEKNPKAFQMLVNSMSARAGAAPAAAATKELDKQSSTPSQYPVSPEQSKQKFIDGN